MEGPNHTGIFEIDAYAPAAVARRVESAGITKAGLPALQTLVLGILTLFLYTVIFRIEPTGEEDEQEKEEQIAEPIPFQKAGLWMGIFIILCAAAMKHLHI